MLVGCCPTHPGLWIQNDVHPGWQVLSSGPQPAVEWFASEYATALPIIRAGRDRSYGGFRLARRLAANERLEVKFWIAASTADWDCREVHDLLAAKCHQQLRGKVRRLHAVSAASRLRIPEPSVQRASS